MPAYSDRPRYELYDEVSNGVSSGIVQWSDYKNSTTGRKFLVVKVTDGPSIGQKIPARYPWVPLLDYDDGVNRYRCTSCDRQYKAGSSRGWCRQCVRKDEGDTRQGSTMAGPGKKFASDGTGHAINPAPVPSKDRDKDSPF